ncbi:MAG: HypC/HybG/HupF family hydrogenase formation chaperone [Deltaproteobacteria bacterium]|nr:MAG: HypC/HybG/HupF family hydrogenase formation chaperone [Deltaproteobacteria bacterium]
MCVAVPGKIISIDEELMATVDFGGSSRDVSISLLEDAAVGEYVIVHAGFALHKVDTKEAEQTIALMAGILDEPPRPE